MALVADGQNQAGQVGGAGHVLALVDAMAHQLFRQHVQPDLHRGKGRRSVQVQGQGDNHRLDAVAFGVFQQFLVPAVLSLIDLHVPPGFLFGLPVILRHQARPRGQRRLAFVIAVESPPNVVRTDVGDCFDFDELGIDRAEQHAAFVAGADHPDPQRLSDRLVVAVIECAEPAADHNARGDAAENEVAPIYAGRRSLLLLSWIHAIHFVLGDLRENNGRRIQRLTKMSSPPQRPARVVAMTSRASISMKSLFTSSEWPTTCGSGG